MPFCRNCGAQMQEEDSYCEACGTAATSTGQRSDEVRTPQSAALPSALTPGFVGGRIASIVGSLMLVIGPFLSFITVYIFGDIGRSGIDWTNKEALVLVGLGVLGVAGGTASLLMKRRKFSGVPFLVGIVSLTVSIWYYVQARDRVSEAIDEDLLASIGTGLYLCLIGSIIILVGGVISAASKKA
ncbi:MAG: zinc ribbon domain-containing protein [Armatimonadetes bacterium]|nr:zinc ribbon domain-containing protein [Armatimonadota bacterium]